MKKVGPFLNFGGNCLEAFRYYEEHLGGKILMSMKYSEQPDPKAGPPGEPDWVIYALLMIGESQLMGSDVPQGTFQPIRSAYMSLSVESIEEAERVHAVLADGGDVFMPMQETFYAFRFSMLRDKFGVLWMVINERPMPSA
jgi:PhnB protein